MVENSDFEEEYEDLDFTDEEELNDNENKKQNVTEEELTKKYTSGQLRIVRTTMDFSLHNLKQVIGDSTYLDTMPSYQRRNRWDRKKKSLLIESFLLNIPVPPIFLFEKDYNAYEVMDGRQRLKAITEFLDDGFSLTSLEFWSELEGKKYSKLPDVLKKGLLRRTISAIVLLAETTNFVDEMDVRMVLFKRLNTGGIQLNNQELRNALYPGAFNNMIIRLSRLNDFTVAWNIPPITENEDIDPPEKLIKNKLYSSMSDCELVLRFFAIRETIVDDLKGSLKKLLDQCMIKHKSDGIEDIEFSENLFKYCIKKLNEIFDNKPFYLPSSNRLSQPLYDALMVAISLVNENELANKKKIKETLQRHLAIKKDYEILTGKGNTVKAIKERIELTKNILLGLE